MGKTTRGEAFFSFYGQSSFHHLLLLLLPPSSFPLVERRQCNRPTVFLTKFILLHFPLFSHHARSHYTGGVHTHTHIYFIICQSLCTAWAFSFVFLAKKTSTSTAENPHHHHGCLDPEGETHSGMVGFGWSTGVDHPKLHQNSPQRRVPPSEPASCEAVSAAEKSQFTIALLHLLFFCAGDTVKCLFSFQDLFSAADTRFPYVRVHVDGRTVERPWAILTAGPFYCLGICVVFKY